MIESEFAAWVAEIGGRLRAARVDAGLSVRDAGEAAGVSPTSVQRSESGETDVCVVMLARLCAAYGAQPAGMIPPYPKPPDVPPPAKKGKGRKS